MLLRHIFSAWWRCLSLPRFSDANFPEALGEWSWASGLNILPFSRHPEEGAKRFM
jgi:hypothetical protein